MKIKNKSNKLKIIVSSAISILLIPSVAVFAYSYTKDDSAPKEQSQKKIDYSESTEDQSNATLDDVNTSDAPSKDEEPASTLSESSSALDIQITSINQNDPLLQIRTLVLPIINSGTCTLILEREGVNTYTSTVDITSMPNSSTCAGFDIPLSSLVRGQWLTTINIVDPEGNSATTSREIEVK